MKNIPMATGIAYLSILFGITLGDIGELSEPKIIEWYLPIQILMVVGFPFFIGIMAGIQIKKDVK